jgi:predicted dithiol-disulfide oxidoreductase (DUF899 family)
MTTATQIEELQKQATAIRAKIAEIRRAAPAEPVKDYELKTSTGETVTLSQLFGDKKELMVVHNMGRGCPYCTLWADGFNGVVKHLENRAAFVVTSPDAPEIQREFAKSRDWSFKMVSTAASDFTRDMGYQGKDGETWRRPGVSVFVKTAAGGIERVSNEEFGPGDDYCQVWHLFDLFPRGADGWEPKFAYRS